MISVGQCPACDQIVFDEEDRGDSELVARLTLTQPQGEAMRRQLLHNPELMDGIQYLLSLGRFERLNSVKDPRFVTKAIGTINEMVTDATMHHYYGDTPEAYRCLLFAISEIFFLLSDTGYGNREDALEAVRGTRDDKDDE